VWSYETAYTLDELNHNPNGVIAGADGALYGTTPSGGSLGGGTVFRLVPSAGAWMVETLHEFDPPTDGASPYSNVVFGSDGALYGTTVSGGPQSGGTAFRLAQSGTSWTLQVIHEFTAPTGSGAYGRLALGTDGALYGTTYIGGPGNMGTVYRLASNGATWSHEVLAAFGDPLPAAGRYPFGGLAIGNDGALYGTASAFDGGRAIRHRLPSEADGSAWVRDVVHTCAAWTAPTPFGDLLSRGARSTARPRTPGRGAAASSGSR
jgi:uncharacterized repeat protein (TIGR03803 family)